MIGGLLSARHTSNVVDVKRLGTPYMEGHMGNNLALVERDQRSFRSIATVSESDEEVYLDLFGAISHSLTESSIRMYKRDFAAYLCFAEGHQYALLEPSTLAAFRDDMILNSEKSPLTINRMLAATKRIMKEAYTHRLIDRDRAYTFEKLDGASVNKLKDRMKHVKTIPIRKTQMQQLCNLPDTSTLLGIRDRAMLYTLATSGIRVAELVTLLVSRVFQQEDGCFIQVLGKRDIEYRQANLSPEAYEYIQEWLRVRGVESPYVFTAFENYGEIPTDKTLSTKAVWCSVKNYSKHIPGLAHLSPHSFRHFLAQSVIKSSGIETARISLGHASISTTQLYNTNVLTLGVTNQVI